ncbi:hypothetical protein L211DRAFT_52817 [Terfezia boudieri ATCC MYA-4762]|uniref:Uncharacterized protein n=1 Tax=Terfezia boudieri ATCC MYA-4762 TaxID=1051890 RepID=A0A3N4M8J3_9PEZI|nr:hypothetical protein L211DRAFT_52817 [Terfezia boudieri ATCC MYA-4762]
MTSFNNTILAFSSPTALDSCPTLAPYMTTDIVPTAQLQPDIYMKLLTANGILFALVMSCLLVADIVMHIYRRKLQTRAMTVRSEPVSEAHQPNKKEKIGNGRATIVDLVDSVPDSPTTVTTNRTESVSETQGKVKATKVDSVDSLEVAEPTDCESLGAKATTRDSINYTT